MFCLKGEPHTAVDMKNSSQMMVCPKISSSSLSLYVTYLAMPSVMLNHCEPYSIPTSVLILRPKAFWMFLQPLLIAWKRKLRSISGNGVYHCALSSMSGRISQKSMNSFPLLASKKRCIVSWSFIGRSIPESRW